MRKRAATDTPSRLNPFKNTFPYLVLITLLFLSVLVWHYYKNTTSACEERRFNEYVDNIVASIFEQICHNEMVLNGVAGLFAATAEVGQEEWSAYFEYQQIVTGNPGIRDAAFAKVIQPSELEQHLETLRAEGHLEYTVWPEGEREIYTPVVLVAPFTESYRAGLGFDMYSNPLRRAVMEKARDAGATAISGKMTIITETGTVPLMGFIMIVPVYAKGAQPNAPEERRAAIMGYVSCFFRIEELMAGIFTDPVNEVAFHLYDGNVISAETLLYDSHITPEENHGRCPLFTSTETLDLYGHQWTMVFESMPAFEAVADCYTHWAILGAGLLINILIFLYLKSLTTTGDRAQTLAWKMTNELRESEAKFSNYINNAPYGVFVHNEKGVILEANKMAYLMSGYSEEELLGMNLSQLIPQTDRQQSREQLHVITEQGSVSFDLPHIRKDGTLREWSVNAVKLSDTLILGFSQDITEKRRAEEALRESEMRSQALVRAIPDLLFRFNREGIYLEAVVKDETILHTKSHSLYRQNRLVGKKITEVLPATIAKKFMAGIEKVLDSRETQVLDYSYQVNNSMCYFEARLAPIATTEVISIVRDVTERKSYEIQLQYISFHDQLTGLYNRRYYENEVKRLDSSREHPIAVISADLDGLKLINDTLGHSEGDNYLKTGADLLKGALRTSDILARVGGDEFAVVLPNTTLEVGQKLVERMRQHIEEYNRQQTTGPPLRISIGVAISESGEHSLEEAYSKADAAMYEDKKQRREK